MLRKTIGLGPHSVATELSLVRWAYDCGAGEGAALIERSIEQIRQRYTT